MIKNTFLYIVAGIFSQLMMFVLWLVLPFFLTSVDIAIYTNYLYYIELFSAFVIVGGDSILVRYYYSEYSKESIFSQIIFTTLVASAALYVVSIIGTYFGLIDFKQSPKWLIYIFPVIVFFNATASLILIHFSANREAAKYSLVQFAKIIVFISIAILFSYLNLRSEGLVFALALSCMLVIVYFIKTQRYSIAKFRFRKDFMREPFEYGYPMMFYSIVGVISLYASRLFLQKNLSLESVGVFSFFLVIVYQFNGLFSSFNKAWTPEVYAKLENGGSKDFLANSAFSIVFLYLTFLLLGALIGNFFIFDHIFRPEYLKQIHVFLILLTFPLFAGVYTVYYPLFYLENKTKDILVISIINSSANILLLYFFIQSFGVNGAAIGTVINSVLGLIVYLIYFRKIVNLSPKMIFWLSSLSFGAILLSVLVIHTKQLTFFYLILLSLMILTFKLGGLRKVGRDLFLTILSKMKYRKQLA
ncbi:MAG: polysaccharide biosynthesis C-terminal domain-containing protein [Sediminibacterium sp.]